MYAAKLEMYNLGSPRVGNSAFNAWYGKSVVEKWRIYNSDDRVVTTPPRLEAPVEALGFNLPRDMHHIYPAVKLSTNGSYEVTQPTLSFSK